MADHIKTWRERIGVGVGYQLHGATDVERAMVAEIADLRGRLERAERALLQAGFEDHGAAEWKPPVNEAASEWLRRMLAAEDELRRLRPAEQLAVHIPSGEPVMRAIDAVQCAGFGASR